MNSTWLHVPRTASRVGCQSGSKPVSSVAEHSGQLRSTMVMHEHKNHQAHIRGRESSRFC
eukprot:4519804-Pleurochrysis_carterae.AAC.1